MIVDYIDEYRHRFGVDPICTVLREHGIKIAPSTYYAAKKRGKVTAAALEEAYAANTVHRLYLANRGLYGVRKLWHSMKRAGHDIGRDQVGRLMAICGAVGVVRGYATSLAQWWSFLEQHGEVDNWRNVGAPAVTGFLSWLRNGRKIEHSLVPLQPVPEVSTLEARLATRWCPSIVGRKRFSGFQSPAS